ncbi:hypothetical protein GQX74_002152 [Glossina fuscipes]|nr:hypothetical protein GQX74_002152 [Glossina fuscipes]
MDYVNEVNIHSADVCDFDNDLEGLQLAEFKASGKLPFCHLMCHRVWRLQKDAHMKILKRSLLSLSHTSVSDDHRYRQHKRHYYDCSVRKMFEPVWFWWTLQCIRDMLLYRCYRELLF